jgi:predicted DNA-binding protein (MmcQ/YjbR family)
VDRQTVHKYLKARVLTGPELRELCLAFPGAFEDFPFSPGFSVFKVAGKIFALSGLLRDPLKVSLKCDPELAVDMRATYAAVGPGYHLNKRHWNTITVDGSLSDRLLRDMVEDSYDLVVANLPQRMQRRLGWKTVDSGPLGFGAH